MATNPRLQAVQQQIKSQGLTREQAMANYNLTQDDTDWMGKNLGLRFAPSAQPQGLMQAGTATPTASAPRPSYIATSPGSRSAPTAAPSPTAAAAAQLAGNQPRPRPAPAQTATTYTPPGAPVPPAAAATASGYQATTARPAAGVVAPNAAPVAQATADTAAATRARVQAGTAKATGARVTNARAVAQSPAAVYDAAQANAATYTPGVQSTVQGQLADIVDSGSPLMERAETRGLQQANRRGLMNSSMAVEAGQAALYDAALPIAQQDATTFATSQRDNTANRQEANLTNAGATNQSRQFNASERNDRSATNAQLGTQVSLANAAARNETSQFNAANATDVSKFNVDRAMQAGIVNQEQANKIRMFNADLVTRTNVSNMANANDFQKFLLDQQLQAGVINQQQYNEMARFNASEANDASQLTATLQSDISKFNASESNDLKALGMDNTTRLTLGTIEANYKVLMQTQAGAGDLYKQYMGSLAAVLQNKDMDSKAKNNAINTLVSGLNGSLDVLGDLANMNIPELVFDDKTDTPSGTPPGTPTGTPTGTPPTGTPGIDTQPPGD